MKVRLEPQSGPMAMSLTTAYSAVFAMAIKKLQAKEGSERVEGKYVIYKDERGFVFMTLDLDEMID